ncbi:MAG: DNA repair protein RecO [bacterium]|nr:DNA repair protein RecO [bacterium]
MEDTYNIKTIILNRKSFSECDSRVVVYSREFGKLELTARGAKKIKSKLAGHLEPLSLTNIMAVRGRRHDYVGAALNENCFSNIKNDLTKLAPAGRAVKIIDQLIKPGLADEKIFELLKNYLETLERPESVIPAPQNAGGIQKELYSDYRLTMLTQLFIFKLLALLGHQPELSVCVSCVNKILPGRNRFDLARGGLVCSKCFNPKDANQLVITDDSIKLLRLAVKCNFQQLQKIKISKKLGQEAGEIIDKFFKYSFN